MLLLPTIDIIESCFQIHNYASSKVILNIIYNKTTQICFTKRYIDFIEESISDKDAFQSLIKELYDNNRLKVEKATLAKNSLIDEFTEIALNAKIPLLIPITINDSNNLLPTITSLVVIEQAVPVNRHWIITNLLMQNICNVSYQDFNNDNAIADFFNSIFTIPKYITSVSIFDREQNHKFFSKIKGKHIEYYTLLSGGRGNEYIRKEIKRELKTTLGGKLKLFYTSNPRALHERKIIFEGIILTIDNSHTNLTTTEQTWEILISYDKAKADLWKDKCNTFIEVND